MKGCGITLLLQQLFSILTVSTTLLANGMYTAMPDKDINGEIFLANRSHPMSKNYVPQTRVVDAHGMRQTMRHDAAEALENLLNAAKEDGIVVSVVSGYRSYSKQATIYERKVETMGSVEKADTLSARAGTSEHQLGLAMDVAQKNSSSLNSAFGKTEEGKWVYKNAHKFGFIVRYMEGFESVTGYNYEPWHIRYVGIPFATAIYESAVPMETFVSAYRLEIYDYLIQSKNDEVFK